MYIPYIVLLEARSQYKHFGTAYLEFV